MAVDVLSGNRPERPTHPNLTDDIWNLTEQCWDRDPQRRPDISEIISRLQVPLTPQYDEIPDDTTLGSVPHREPSHGEYFPIPPDEVISTRFKVSRYQASRQTPGFCGLDRFWKFGKSHHPPRFASTYGFESEEYEKSVDTGRESVNPAGSKGRYLPLLEAHPTRSCHNRPNSSLEKRRMVNPRDGVSGSNF